jgi:hypothetical protein
MEEINKLDHDRAGLQGNDQPKRGEPLHNRFPKHKSPSVWRSAEGRGRVARVVCAPNF